MKFILHSYRRCPFCIRTRIVLCLKGIPYEVVEEPLREWTPWMKEWSSASGERARVPVLQVIYDNGKEEIIPESNTVNLFLDAFDNEPKFTPGDNTPAYAEMLTWWKWCAEALKPTLDLYKYGENLQFDIEKHVMHTEALQKLVQVLEDTLQGKHCLIGNELTLADIAIIPFIRQIMRTREGEFDFTPYPKVRAWTNGLIETDWFTNEVMKQGKT